jgi:hypothetical protein
MTQNIRQKLSAIRSWLNDHAMTLSYFCRSLTLRWPTSILGTRVELIAVN